VCDVVYYSSVKNIEISRRSSGFSPDWQFAGWFDLNDLWMLLFMNVDQTGCRELAGIPFLVIGIHVMQA